MLRIVLSSGTDADAYRRVGDIETVAVHCEEPVDTIGFGLAAECEKIKLGELKCVEALDLCNQSTLDREGIFVRLRHSERERERKTTHFFVERLNANETKGERVNTFGSRC